MFVWIEWLVVRLLQIQQMYMRILAQRAAYQSGAAAVKTNNDKPRYEYDSDEDTEGGTWEHKKRKKEMRKTEGLYYRTLCLPRLPIFQHYKSSNISTCENRGK